MDPPFTVLFDEINNIVEIRYDGANTQLLLDLIDRVVVIEGEIASDNTNNELDALEDDLNSLTTIVQAQSSALTNEISNRTASDASMTEGFTNELINQQQEYSAMITAEAELRAQAILDEATARGAAIAESEAIIMTDVAILATSVEGMATELGAAQSSIIEVQDSLVTETMARTAQYSALQADYGSTNAAVLEESVARASEDEALAYQVSIVEANVADNSAAILNEQSARVSADEAIAEDLTTLSAVVDGNTAAIVSESTARTTADEALASDITALEVSMGSGSASVSAEAEARIAADNAINAKYSVKVAVNGRVSGFDLISTANVNETPFSKFVFNSDSFEIFNGITDIAPFRVEGGIVYMQDVRITNAVIDNLAITNRTVAVDAIATPNIQNSAVSMKVSAEAVNVLTPVNQTLVVLSLTATTQGISSSTIFWSCEVKYNQIFANVTARLLRDGSVLDTVTDDVTPATTGSTAHISGLRMFEDLPSAGAHTYTIDVVSGGSCTVHKRNIMILENKK